MSPEAERMRRKPRPLLRSWTPPELTVIGVGRRYMVEVRATSRPSATYGVAPAALAGLLALTSTLAWGDVGHAHAPDESTQVPRVVWLLGIALTILVGFLLLRQARRGGDYLRRVRGFSRNARLLLLRTPFSGLSVSIWRLLFYLYLLASGHDTLFVAQLASINWIAHGLSVIPSGILSDLFGRRRVFLISYSGNILGTAGLIVAHDPMALLVLAAVQGAFEGGHAIVGPPFMVEQSRPAERVHLFSIGSFLTVGAGFALGMTAPFFAVYFAHELHASTTAIGVIFGAGSIVTAFATLLGPVVVRRLGRVRTVAYLKFLGVPFLALIALAPGVVTAGVAYLLTIVFIGGAFPNKSLTDPIYSLFSMEVVKDRERGTTYGLMHAFSA